ncbi:MAG TPA: Omp28-related outer membrane protein [Candidatus Kapabacteria bacterium]|nr:Omp28-related outer membrane protein [Candidatus Kapabacteria bacterium]
MKRSILIALLTLFVAVSASAQRKVLIEEFTSSTCGPCAGTDPIMELFEEEYHDKIVILKYHQNYPQTGDIMYNAYPDGRKRHDYYQVGGIPHVQFNGAIDRFPSRVDTLTSATGQVMNLTAAYYTLTVTQEITADSIIANVTVKANGTVDPEARLVVVVAEANVLHQASNRRLYHTAAVRAAMPAFAANGGPSGDALTIPANGEQTFRFAAELNSAWDPALLQLVAFVQNPTTKAVMGVETNKPSIFVERKGGSASVVGGTQQPHWLIKNNGATAQSVKLSTDLSKTAPYSTTIKHLNGTPIGANEAITLAPGEEKEIIVEVASSGATSEIQIYTVNAATADGVGIIGSGGLAWGKDKTDIFVDAGVGSYTQTYQGAAPYQAALSTAKMPVTYLSDDELREGFEALTNFKNVFYAAAYAAGIYSDNGDVERVKAFVQGGGNLVFSSMVMASAYSNAGLTDIPEELFGVTTPGAVNGAWTDLLGIENDPVGNGVETSVSNIVITQPLEVSDLVPSAAAAYKNENDEIVGVHAEHVGGGKTLYLSFEPGNITSTTQRRAVIKQIVDWLNGVQDVTPSTIASGNELKQNFPNPFNPSTDITFELARRSNVSLVIQDMMGREVATLIDNQMIDEGAKTVRFNADDLASGNYMYVLTVDGVRMDRKMTLSK